MELYLFLRWGAIASLVIIAILAIDGIRTKMKGSNEENRTSDQ